METAQNTSAASSDNCGIATKSLTADQQVKKKAGVLKICFNVCFWLAFAVFFIWSLAFWFLFFRTP